MTEFQSDRLLGPLLERAAVGIAVLDADCYFAYVNERLAEINGVAQEAHEGRPVEEVIPHIARPVRDLHAEVMRTREPVRDVQIAGSTPGAADRIWHVSYLPIESHGEPAVGVVLIDVTERERAVEESHRRVRQHAAVADLGQRALSGADLGTLLTAACELLVSELGADNSGVLKMVPGAGHLVMEAGCGWPEGAIGRVTADLGRKSQAGFTLMEGGPVFSPDLAHETRYHISPAVQAMGVQSCISTPIPGGSEPFGVLGIYARATHHFNADDAGFVRAVANVVGAAVLRDEQQRALGVLSAQRGRLVAQALEAGEHEQRRVADLLHDDVLQHLLFARQELDEAGKGGAAVERAVSSVDEAASILRNVVAGLHPVTLAHGGLAAALETLAGEYRARSGLKTEVQVDPGAEDTHDRLVLSIVRELLTNVTKHAGAKRAQVRLMAADGALELTVADDGAGLPPDALTSALQSGNIGLATVRERVEALGGSLRTGPGMDGVGAGLEIRLPI